MSSLARTEIDGVIRHTLEDRNIVFSRVGDSGYDLTLENTKHLASAVRLLVADKSLLVEAFFVRRPDDNAAELYRFLLERNGRMYGVHFAIDAKGDVYLIGRLPLMAVTPDEIARLLGCVVAYADESFEAAQQLGLAGSVRREWDWPGWQGHGSSQPSNGSGASKGAAPASPQSPPVTAQVAVLPPAHDEHRMIDLTEASQSSMTGSGRHRRRAR
ncbi:MAG TPA: YbjN domain-containing protein [Acidothermaceae bacterium]